MGALLDTHALIWWIEGDARITPKLRRMIGQPSEDVYVSAATAWEIATKTRIGKLKTPKALLRGFVEAIELLGFLPLPITLRHGFEAGQLPSTHRDPFDRMLAAQARAEGLILISCDPAFEALGLKTVWLPSANQAGPHRSGSPCLSAPPRGRQYRPVCLWPRRRIRRAVITESKWPVGWHPGPAHRSNGRHL